MNSIEIQSLKLKNEARYRQGLSFTEQRKIHNHQIALLNKKYNKNYEMYSAWKIRKLAYVSKFWTNLEAPFNLLTTTLNPLEAPINLLTTTLNPIDRSIMIDYYTYNVDPITGNQL